ncbi:MAG: protein-L-isoaspartate(D-aspartate) O-methyltransferase [Bauldia sp.]
MTPADPRADEATGETDLVAAADLLLRLRRRGITDQRLAGAIEAVPRRLFVPAAWQAFATIETSIPIDCGQTLAAPEIVGRMTAALDLLPSHRVLQVGVGSGYQTAILAGLCRHVYGVERYRSLIEAARQRLTTLGIANVTLVHGDGFIGLPTDAPFDRIVVTAAVTELPPAIRDQIGPGGAAVIAIGPQEDEQRLVKIERGADGLNETEVAKVRFVPLVPGKAAVL